MDKQRFIESREGVPQGGPLSPLRANILLDSLDKELEKRGVYVQAAVACGITSKGP